MTPLEVLSAVIAILVGGAIIYFVILPSASQSTANQPPALFVEVPATTLPNHPIAVTIAASSAKGKTIEVTSDGETRNLSCINDPCVFNLSYSYSTPGTKLISVQLDSLSAQRSVEVTTVTSRCIDGTPQGACATPPLYCDGLQLVSNCELCGCSDGKQCVSDVCVAPPLTFSILSFDVPSTVYTTAAATLSYTLQNTSTYPADKLFLLVVSSYDSSQKLLDEKPQQIQLSNLAPTETFSGTIRAVFSTNTKTVRLRMYDNPTAYPASTLLAESSTETVSVVTDTTPPLPPTNLHITGTGTSAQLEWTASSSSDVDHYAIYRENFSNGGFTTYSNAGEVTNTVFSLPSSPEALAYVVRAVDGAGNESDPSSPVVAGAT